MAGRTHDAEGILRFALHHEIDGVEARSGGAQCHIERSRADVGIACAERCAPLSTSRRAVAI